MLREQSPIRHRSLLVCEVKQGPHTRYHTHAHRQLASVCFRRRCAAVMDLAMAVGAERENIG